MNDYDAPLGKPEGSVRAWLALSWAIGGGIVFNLLGLIVLILTAEPTLILTAVGADIAIVQSVILYYFQSRERAPNLEHGGRIEPVILPEAPDADV